MPGAAIGVLRDGVATTACYGVVDVRGGGPVTLESLFGVGSLTKSMVATVIVRLGAGQRRLRVAGADGDGVAEVVEPAGERLADHAGAEDCDVHGCLSMTRLADRSVYLTDPP